MFGSEELKKKTEVRGDAVVCPVIGCETQIKKMRKEILKSLDAYLEKARCKTGNFGHYLCEEHKIYITPTTFSYQDIKDNLPWRDSSSG